MPKNGFEKDKKWNDVMHFLEKNPNVLMEMIPNQHNQTANPSDDNNRQGIINYRNVTGITAPGRRGK